MQISLVFLVIVLRFASSAPAENLPVLGIVGGERAPQTYFNFQVSLQLWRQHFCGGTLVTTNIVVTAAHCTSGRPILDFTVRTGSALRENGGQVYEVKKILNHPYYSNGTYNYDVAVILLRSHVRLSKNVGTLSMATIEPRGNSPALISGWGHTKEGGVRSRDLMYAQITIFDRQYCQSKFYTYTENMICGGRKEGGVDTCQADSGGPLVINRKLVGIVSFGKGCARPNNPGVYSNVAVLKPWIDQSIKYLLSYSDNDDNNNDNSNSNRKNSNKKYNLSEKLYFFK